MSGYIVLYKPKVNPSAEYSSIGSIKTIVTLQGLDAGTSYWIRIVPYSIEGVGVASKAVIGKTLDAGTNIYHFLIVPLNSAF